MLIPGHVSLPDACPLCGHRPLRAEDCIENVPLRKTVQVFLRHAEEKSQAQSGTTTSKEPSDVVQVCVSTGEADS